MAAVVVSASRSAADERLGSPGSKPCTTSKAPSESVAARFARTPIGNATRSVSDVGTAAPIATTSPTMPRCRARRPSSRSVARDDGATIVTFLTAAPQGLRGAADVLVDVVRLRPRERGHEADPERHRARILALASSQLESGDDRRHDHRSRERALQDHRADHDRRPRRQSVRASTRERGRALPLRPLEEQAVLRRDSSGDRIPGRGHGAHGPSDRLCPSGRAPEEHGRSSG